MKKHKVSVCIVYGIMLSDISDRGPRKTLQYRRSTKKPSRRGVEHSQQEYSRESSIQRDNSRRDNSRTLLLIYIPFSARSLWIPRRQTKKKSRKEKRGREREREKKKGGKNTSSLVTRSSNDRQPSRACSRLDASRYRSRPKNAAEQN